MRLGNGPDRFGPISRALHWAMAVAILGMLGFGTYIANMTVNLSNLHLYGWHKSIGLTLLALVVIRLAWHRASPVPAPLPDTPLRTGIARAVHGALYLLMIAVPLTGWVASSATGIEVQVWGLTLPPIVTASETVEERWFALHGAGTKLLAALVVLHVAGALLRRDGTLGRMVRGRA